MAGSQASICYPRIALLDARIRALQDELAQDVAAAFPLGSKVRVSHDRGFYYAEVTHHETARSFLTRIWVRNLSTGKISKPWVLRDTRGLPCVQALHDHDCAKLLGGA